MQANSRLDGTARQSEPAAPTATPRASANPGTQVTHVLRHRVASDDVPAYERLLARLIADAQAVPGFLGVHLILPAPGEDNYMLVPRFERADQLARWIGSDGCRAVLADIDQLIVARSAAAMAQATASRSWFFRLLARVRAG
jgi:antibiotic biosynthesis monooxygenase (ABM) superfamily enzyme